MRALTRMAGSDTLPRPRRDDVTLVIDALRCALTAEELVAFAEGVEPARMLVAYRMVDEQRRHSVNAWRRIARSPHLVARGDTPALAARLLPVPIARLRETAETNPSGLPAAVARAVAQIADVAQRAKRLEQQMLLDPQQAESHGLLLYNPIDGGAWDLPYFLPPRVGTLSPARLADLLGERQADTAITPDFEETTDPPERRPSRRS